MTINRDMFDTIRLSGMKKDIGADIRITLRDGNIHYAVLANVNVKDMIIRIYHSGYSREVKLNEVAQLLIAPKVPTGRRKYIWNVTHKKMYLTE